MTTNAADTNNVQYVDPIEDAKQIAREAIHETGPTAVEIVEPTNGMYRFDAICIDEEERFLLKRSGAPISRTHHF